jgi:hypothetical protein
MTIILQIATVVVIGVAAFFLARSRGARHQAIRRVLLMVFVMAAASSVFVPEYWTKAANLVGVGRGTDLLLYLLVLVFLAFVATTYRRFRHLEEQNTELARAVAILQAGSPNSARDLADDAPS